MKSSSKKNALMASWCAATPCGLDSAMYGGFSKDPMGCANREKSSEGDMILDEQLSRYYLENAPLKFKATLLKRQIMYKFELKIMEVKKKVKPKAGDQRGHAQKMNGWIQAALG